MAIPTKFWRGSIELTSETLTVSVPDATVGRKLLCFASSRFTNGSQSIPANWTSLGWWNESGNAAGSYLLEKAADGNDDITFDNWTSGARLVAAIIVELDEVDGTTAFDSLVLRSDTANEGYSQSIVSPTGAPVITQQPGITVALLGVKDSQDFSSQTQPNSLVGVTAPVGYSGEQGAKLGNANKPLAAIAFREYSATGSITEQEWTNSVNVSDWCFGGSISFPYAAAPTGTNIKLGDVEITEVYIGDVPITACYLGDVKIFGP